jgi:hypothetical protein
MPMRSPYPRIARLPRAIGLFALRNTGRMIAALVALGVAAAVTQTAPIAVRRKTDFGFSPSSAGLIDAYFTVMVGAFGVLVLAGGTWFYLVAKLGDRRDRTPAPH